jgi:hypothetical protein
MSTNRSTAAVRQPATDHLTIIARGRLKDASKVFASRGWDVLPQGRRGQAILRWGADHAFLADPINPLQSVRRWCLRRAPWLKDAELAEIIAYTKTSNKRYTPDQCAMVLKITVSDRNTIGLRFIGADNDRDYEQRRAAKNAKNAAANRRWRAAHSTGRKRGRPPLQLSEADRKARGNARAAERMRRLRALRKNARCYIKNIDGITQFSVTLPIRTDAIDFNSLNLARFGITRISITNGTSVIREWRREAVQ